MTILMNASMIFFTLAKLNQLRKYMLKVATEMQSNLKSKAPEWCQRCSGVYLFVKQNLSRHFFLQPNFDEFLKKVMNSEKDKLTDKEEELLEDEDPFLCVW